MTHDTSIPGVRFTDLTDGAELTHTCQCGRVADYHLRRMMGDHHGYTCPMYTVRFTHQPTVCDVSFTVMAANVPPGLQDAVRELLSNALDVLVDTAVDMADIDDETADHIDALDISWHIDAY